MVWGLDRLGVDVTEFERLLPILIAAFVGTPVVGVVLTLKDQVEGQQKLLDNQPEVYGERLNDAVKYNRQVDLLHQYLTYYYSAYRTFSYAEKLRVLRLFYAEEIEEAIFTGEKIRRQQ